MGLYDRDYTKADYQPGHHGVPQMQFRLPRLTPAVKWLLIINIAVFLISIIIPPLGRIIYSVFQLDATSAATAVQLWRLISYQFLHSPTQIFHIFFNMLGLFFLGPTLERSWGSKKFVYFYLTCGVAGGLFYLFLAGVGFLPAGPMVGASGAILGLLAACAIRFPQFVVFILLFPVPIRIAAIGFTLVFIVNIITKGQNAGGDAAHLAGMAAGAAYVLLEPYRAKLKSKARSDNWRKNLEKQQKLKFEVDRILKKVHDKGIHSLTSREKRTLKKATKEQQNQNRF